MADKEDESGQLGASGILIDLQSWPVVKTEGWERGCGDNTSRPVCVPYYGAVLKSVWDNTVLAARVPLTSLTNLYGVRQSLTLPWRVCHHAQTVRH